MKDKEKNKWGPWRAEYANRYDWILELLASGLTYQQVSEKLYTDHKIKRSPSTIWNFVNIRRLGKFGPRYDYVSSARLPIPPIEVSSASNVDPIAAAKVRLAAAQAAKANKKGMGIDPSDVYPEV